jgi:hypothetical protein
MIKIPQYVIEDKYTSELIAIYNETNSFCFGEIVISKDSNRIGLTYISYKANIKAMYGERYDFMKGLNYG